MTDNLLSIPFATLDQRTLTLSELPAKAYLIVNTASKCGFTPQYQGLETLHKNYVARGLQVIGFPCNQFGGQEPGSAEDISQFCELNYGVSFPLAAKVDVNGKDAHPLFVALKHQAPGILGTEMIKWNFTKFLVDDKGQVVKRYGSATKPEELVTDIESLLG